MVQNPIKPTPLPPPTYGATAGGGASEKRAALFSPDPQLREAALQEALREIEKKGGQGSAQAWWAFEGFTHVDACFDTPECLLIVEGKRTEIVSPSTRCFASRNQLWRNVEVAGELAAGRPFGVTAGLRSDPDPVRSALGRQLVSRDDIIDAAIMLLTAMRTEQGR